MPDLQSLEEEAARYVLNELSPADRRRFEDGLDRSIELRTLVRQLEEGALAVALASKRRQPPPELWGAIERAVSDDTCVGPVLSTSVRRAWKLLWRNGWAFGAACLAVWLLSLAYFQRHTASALSTAAVERATSRRESGSQTNSAAHTPAQQPRPTVAGDSPADAPAEAQAPEIQALRLQVAALSNRVGMLSEALARWHVVSTGPGQFRFFQLTSTLGTGEIPGPISTNLQRALFIAMARELGWLPASAVPHAIPESDSIQTTNSASVDFVDLRLGTNNMTYSVPTSAATETSAAFEPPYIASASSAVPGFISGTNAILAFDSSIVPTGGSLTFWGSAGGGQQSLYGTASVGSSPLVVTVPIGSSTSGSLLVIAEGPGGSSNVFQFPAMQSP